MTLPLRVSPAASRDAESAAGWYEDVHPGLGRRFLAEVLRVARRVEIAPMQFPVIEPDVRRALLRTFPYAMYFVVEPQEVVVIAIVHLHRHSDVWRRRLHGS